MCYLLQNRLHWLCGPSNLLFSGYRGSFPVVERRGREVKLTPSFGAEIKNKWNTHLSPLCPFMRRTGKTVPFKFFFLSWSHSNVFLFNFSR